MTGYNPDSWLDILGLLILALAFVGAAAVPAWISHRKQNKTLNTIRDQVENSHTDRNLRDDIDKVIHGVESLHDRVDGIATRVDGLASRVDRLAS